MSDVTPRWVQVGRRPLEVRAPGPRLRGVGHIAVAREDKLGDFVLALPAIARIRATYPEAVLSVVVDKSVVPLAEIVPGVSGIFATDAATSVRQLARQLKGGQVDTLVAISRKSRAPLAARVAGIANRVGSSGRWWSPLFSRKVVESRRRGERHELEYALSFAHRVGASPAEAQFPIEIPDGAREAARRFLEDHEIDGRFVILHPGSGGSCPAWPLEHYASLAGRLVAEEIPVVASIGPEDSACAAALEPHARFSGDLPTLAALLDEAALVVSNSTGPLHLAAALDTPTIAIHAPWSSCSAVRWGPYSARGWALIAETAEAKAWSRAERARRGAALLAALEPQLVLDRAQRILR